VSTRSPEELTGNQTQSRGLHHFTDGLASVYRTMARALKPSAPLAFTFHHNQMEAYYAVGVAILDSGLVCSATLPCPAEMGGSIHIHGTGSSIVDTVFVCRSHGVVRRSHLFRTSAELIDLIRGEVGQLRKAGVKPTAGDVRCIVYGHLTRMGVWNLRKSWDRTASTEERLARFAAAVTSFGNPRNVIDLITHSQRLPTTRVAEPPQLYGTEEHDAVSF
jgi:adenine-specific DNA methylase